MSSPIPCPLCLPRPDDSAEWLKVEQLAVSTLYLNRNQTYRGHCQLIYDKAHVEGLEKLPHGDFRQLMADLQRAAQAIERACNPDHMNYASLGNVVRHLHWHLVPRYRTDPRWGSAIWTTHPSEMPVTQLEEAQYHSLAGQIRGQLHACPA